MVNTAWPVAADVQRLLTAVGIPALRVSSADTATHIGEILAGVAAQFQQKAGRNFLPATVDTTRFYDGLGVSEIEVDEMSALTSASVVDSAGGILYTYPNAKLVFEQQKPMTRLLAAPYSLSRPDWQAAFEGDLPPTVGAWAAQSWVFPAGRQNIAVTGRFNYGAAIPDDVWLAVAQESAYRLACELCFLPTGRIGSYQVTDLKTTYALDRPAVIGWHEAWTAALTLYRQSPGRRFRRLAPRMV